MLKVNQGNWYSDIVNTNLFPCLYYTLPHIRLWTSLQLAFQLILVLDIDFCRLDVRIYHEQRSPVGVLSPFISTHAIRSTVSSLSFLLQKEIYKNQVETLLVTHIYPEFKSEQGFLRARVSSHFSIRCLCGNKLAAQDIFYRQYPEHGYTYKFTCL